MVSKVRNFWLCVFSGVVATTLISMFPASFKKISDSQIFDISHRAKISHFQNMLELSQYGLGLFSIDHGFIRATPGGGGGSPPPCCQKGPPLIFVGGRLGPPPPLVFGPNFSRPNLMTKKPFLKIK